MLRNILKIFTIPLMLILLSFYFFPIEFVGFPGINTKMVEALFGLLLFLLKTTRKGSGMFDNGIMRIFVWATIVSVIGFASVAINGTPDYAYATYLISAAVWIAAAYFVVNIMGAIHGGEQSPVTMMNYLIVLCILQCGIALWMDQDHGLRDAVDAVVAQGQDFLNSSNVRRLYGIGASLDVAGTRFAVVLCMISFLAVYFAKKTREHFYEKNPWLYVIAFIIIAVAGNMVARTTLIGVIVAVVYIACNFRFIFLRADGRFNSLLLWLVLIFIIAIPVCTHLYHTDPQFQKNLRFAFEGFFNYYENGTWQVDSTDKLSNMYVFPDNLKTWIIGDGYFSSPFDTDPYYIGEYTGGYYMGTDVGYLRFIFYFGVIGMAAMCFYIYQVYRVCVDRFPDLKWLFFMTLIINYVVWFKVATDVFLVFALFAVMKRDERFQIKPKPLLEADDNKEDDEPDDPAKNAPVNLFR